MIDILVQSRRNRRAAVRFFRKLLKSQGCVPRRLITDKLRSYPSACRRDAVRGPLHGPVCEQSRRSVASTDPSARAADAPLQIGRPATALCVRPRRGAESLPRRPTSPAVGSSPPAPHEGIRRMGGGDVRLLRHEGSPTSRARSAPPAPSRQCRRESAGVHPTSASSVI